jgi:ATP-dependent helicase/nuclease subunit B
MRALWQPRLLKAIDWIAEEVAKDRAEGREVRLVEVDGSIPLAGVRLKGKADRIDRLTDGGIAVIDYKTGKPPSGAQVAAGFAMQLGLIGLIAERGGFPGLPETAVARCFEYWSLAKYRDAFGYRTSPVDPDGKRGRTRTDAFTAEAERSFTLAAGKWLTGDAPFTAEIQPDLPRYGEYDQLMRLEEWYGREEGT